MKGVDIYDMNGYNTAAANVKPPDPVGEISTFYLSYIHCTSNPVIL
jgi:hypothetical protein